MEGVEQYLKGSPPAIPLDQVVLQVQSKFLFKLVCVGRVPDPTSHFPPDPIFYVNLVAMGTT
jgi:hypothetical protein